MAEPKQGKQVFKLVVFGTKVEAEDVADTIYLNLVGAQSVSCVRMNADKLPGQAALEERLEAVERRLEGIPNA